MITLYDYYRSSASYRVRIALHYKKIPHEHQSVHLVDSGGEQFAAQYQALNPQCLVPTLKDDDHLITQSIAILEYLEEKFPEPSLLPDDITQRAQIRAFAHAISSDIHPLNNLRVLKYLVEEGGLNQDKKEDWYAHWIKTGFTALEKQIQGDIFCFPEQLSFADICLIPQVYNALRFNVDMQPYPKIMAVNEYCLTMDAFKQAAP